ncbi:uncharacterized protein EI97DRAFT_271051 [Westerdykella ornata]|uniref:Uncharacterized protein n=1 Tax=Westerdykella ornata TaxID=318751 RepID=A0A6A6JNK6_WESOR|nr:uncharacterized protein EI97DRAFT_271051 [Westerdykella ornata]KAF2277713.1 hypothetical protein EI97DRAFT_271051 [Westerdykella ornata]
MSSVAQHERLFHTVDKERDLFTYRWLPFSPAHYKSIITKLRLPQQYFQVRTTGGAHAGGAAYRTYRDEKGRVLRTSLIVRASSSDRNKHHAPVTLTLSWSAPTGRTTGYINGISPSDLQSFVNLINSCTTFLGHPLTVAEIFLHLIVRNLNEVIRLPEEERYYVDEIRTGLAEAQINPSKTGNHVVWGWKFQDFLDSTTRANMFLTTLAYLQRRFQFAHQVYGRLLNILEEFETYEFESPNTKVLLERGANERRERLTNRLNDVENYQHQCQCMQMRAENMIKVLYTVLSQIDSRTQSRMAQANLGIAQAVRSDSIPIRTIAYVSLVFLPGTFIASIFGTNFFGFEAQTRSLTVAASFWKYWAITIPVTICVLLLWNFWVWWEKRYVIAPRENELEHPLGSPLANETGIGNIIQGERTQGQGAKDRI